MICPICNQKIKDDSKFCGKCGHKIPRCPTCGRIIYKKMRFCVNDGTPIPEDVLALLKSEDIQTQNKDIPMDGVGAKADKTESIHKHFKSVKKSRRYVWRGIGVIFLLTIAIVGGYYIYQKMSPLSEADSVNEEKTSPSEETITDRTVVESEESEINEEPEKSEDVSSEDETDNSENSKEKSTSLPEEQKETEESDLKQDEETENSFADDLDIEDTVAQIREWYYYPSDSETSITIESGTDGWQYTRQYYYHNDEVYFAFIFNGTEEHRLYFKENQMIRYIDENGNIFDYGNLADYAEWENRAIKEAYSAR